MHTKRKYDFPNKIFLTVLFIVHFNFILQRNTKICCVAVKGHGPNEVIALDMLQNPHGDTLEIIDQAKYKVFKYLLRNDKATLIGVNNLKMKAAGPLQEIYRHNDSILVFNTLHTSSKRLMPYPIVMTPKT